MEIDRIVRVDMTTGDIREERAPAHLRYLGGRALGARLHWFGAAPITHRLAPGAEAPAAAARSTLAA